MRKLLAFSIAAVLVGASLAAGPVAGAGPKPRAFDFTMSGDQVVPGPGDADGTANANLSLFLQDIQDNPDLYYLDAHNAEFPDGAIRGQLA